MMPLVKSEHQKSSFLEKLLMFLFYLWRQNRSEHQKYSLPIRLSTFWYYLWRQKRSECRKSNFLWLSTFFLKKWFLMFWWSFQHSDIFDFQCSNHPRKTFAVLTLQCSDSPFSHKNCNFLEIFWDPSGCSEIRKKIYKKPA